MSKITLRALSLILAALMLASIIACTKAPTTSDTPTDATEESDIPTEKPTDKPEEPKLDTEDSGKAKEEAEWIPHQEEDRIEYECSNCSWMALNDYRGRSTDSLYCPHCGKYMTNSTMPLED